MEVNIIEEKKNGLFSRNEVKLEVKAEVTPSKIEVIKMIAEKFKVGEDLVRIRDIIGKFGVSIFTVRADVYDSIEEFNRVVKKTKQEVEAIKKAEDERLKAIEEEKKAKEEAEAAAKVEAEADKPVEEVKEEKSEKEEEKKE